MIKKVMEEGSLKVVRASFDDHKQKVCVDFQHKHCGLIPHKHYNIDHSDNGIPPSKEELELADKIRKKFNLI